MPDEAILIEPRTAPEPQAEEKTAAPVADEYGIPDAVAADEKVPAAKPASKDVHANAEGESAPVAESEPAVDEAILTRATQAGLTESDVKGLSPGSLAKVLDAFDAAKPKAPAAQAAPPKKFQAPALDPEVFDAEIIRFVTSMTDEYNAAMAQMHEQQAQLMASMGQELKTAQQRRLDGYFGTLGKDWDTVFGKGNDANRRMIQEEMEVISAGLKATGRAMPDESELFKRAVNGLFSEQQQKIAQNKLNKSLRDSSGQFVAKPTHRNGVVMTPTQKAEASVAALLMDRGGGRELGLEEDAGF